MSKKIRWKWNWKGFDELRKSPGIMKAVDEAARNVASRAGEGYEVTERREFPSRQTVNVYPATKEAKRDNMENNTLVKVAKA